MGVRGVAVGRLGELPNDSGTAREYLIFTAPVEGSFLVNSLWEPGSVA